MLELVDAEFDGVPLLAGLAVEGWRHAATAAEAFAVGGLVSGLRSHRPEPAPTQVRTDSGTNTEPGNSGDPKGLLDYVRQGGERVSWPSVIILVPAERRPSLEGRIRSLELVPDSVTGDERLHQHGYSYSIDLSGGILSDYEPEELEQVTIRIGNPYAVYVSCQAMDAARAFLRDILPGVDGLVDTNHFEILQASEFLTLVDRYPGWDWRRQPSTDLQ